MSSPSVCSDAFASARTRSPTGVTDDPPAGWCAIRGTAGVDTLTGTAGRDMICGFGGNDVTEGLGGDDVRDIDNGELGADTLDREGDTARVDAGDVRAPE